MVLPSVARQLRSQQELRRKKERLGRGGKEKDLSESKFSPYLTSKTTKAYLLRITEIVIWLILLYFVS